jgi:lysophospholipase L1-like esterase
MNRRTIHVTVVAAIALISSVSSLAQAPAAPTSPPKAIDSLLTTPIASLTPDQVKTLQSKLVDWPNLERYQYENSKLPPTAPGRVVFFGDSITDAWGRRAPVSPFFPGKPYVNRGISGQTTPQMLIRFQQDVVALHPEAVLILAGTNDIAGNTGLSTIGMIEDNFRSMAAIAQAAHIKLILASVLPVDDYPWRRGLNPSAKVLELNTWLKSFAAEQHGIYLDYYTALATAGGAMKPGTAADGVHPTPAGYAIMAPLAQAAIDQALGK